MTKYLSTCKKKLSTAEQPSKALADILFFIMGSKASMLFQITKFFEPVGLSRFTWLLKGSKHPLSYLIHNILPSYLLLKTVTFLQTIDMRDSLNNCFKGTSRCSD